MIKIKRIYEKFSPDDGFRILVDRLWPRGVSKEGAHVDLWMKDVAPTDSLRKWFAHDPAKWDLFGKRYGEELRKNGTLLGEIRDLEKRHKIVTLVYSARDEQHNNAVVLKKVLHAA